MDKFSAEKIYTNTGTPLANHVIVVDQSGTILALDPIQRHDPASIRKIPGIILPGFINAHCHLELSHMKGKIDTGTGLLPFLHRVVNFRDIQQEEIDDAIIQADLQMNEAGIVAVGDISNKTDSFAVKKQSPIQYYTFVEMFDFLQDEMAGHFFDQYKVVYDQAPSQNGNSRSAVPHAPYTVSRALFQKINRLNGMGKTISIHNQETPAENELFMTKEGGFLSFFKNFGFSLDQFRPTAKPSIHYSISQLNRNTRCLFVHNTMSSSHDIGAAHRWSDQIFWVTCPNANLFIENRLPDYQIFMDQKSTVCIGTDSLTSNWQLSIFEEMKTIARYQSYVPTEEIIRWATINGAEALGFDDDLGAVKVGKKPGLNAITLNEVGKIDQNSTHLKLL